MMVMMIMVVVLMRMRMKIITTTFLYTHILVLIITKGLKDSYSHSLKDKGETLRNQVTWEGER